MIPSPDVNFLLKVILIFSYKVLLKIKYKHNCNSWTHYYHSSCPTEGSWLHKSYFLRNTFEAFEVKGLTGCPSKWYIFRSRSQFKVHDIQWPTFWSIATWYIIIQSCQWKKKLLITSMKTFHGALKIASILYNLRCCMGILNWSIIMWNSLHGSNVTVQNWNMEACIIFLLDI